MKFVYPEIEHIIDFKISNVNCLVVENQRLFRTVVEDICNQCNGDDGNAVVSENDKPMHFAKTVEFISTFVPFDLNRKSLVNKIISNLEKTAVDGEHFMETSKLLSDIGQYFDSLSFELDLNLEYGKGDIGSVLKSFGIHLQDDYDSLAESLVDYMELMRRLEGKELFITVNMRSYIDNEEMERFAETIENHEIFLLMIENKEYPTLTNEKRYIVDEDLCEI